MIAIITEQDIEQGIRNDPTRCPIGRCLQRTYPNAEIDVTPERIFISYPYGPGGDTVLEHYRTLPAARAFVVSFDAVGPLAVSAGPLKLWQD